MTNQSWRLRRIPDSDDLAQALDDMPAESPDGNLASEAADQHFHRIISEATRNAMLMVVIDELWFVRDNSPAVHEAYQSICAIDDDERQYEHREIYDALERRDPVGARTAMHAHFLRILNKLIAANEAEQVEAVRERVRVASDSRCATSSRVAEEVRRRQSAAVHRS